MKKNLKPGGKRRKVEKLKKHPNLDRGPREPAKRNQNMSAKLSVKKLYENVVRANPDKIEKQILKGIEDGGYLAHAHIQTAANYIDGRPVQAVELRDRRTLIIHLENGQEETLERD